MSARTERVLIVCFLLASCVAVLFVITTIRGPGRAWYAKERSLPEEAPLPQAPSPQVPVEASAVACAKSGTVAASTRMAAPTPGTPD